MMNREGYLSLFRQWEGIGYHGIKFYNLLMLLNNSVQKHSNIGVQLNKDIEKLERKKRGFLEQ